MTSLYHAVPLPPPWRKAHSIVVTSGLEHLGKKEFSQSSSYSSYPPCPLRNVHHLTNDCKFMDVLSQKTLDMHPLESAWNIVYDGYTVVEGVNSIEKDDTGVAMKKCTYENKEESAYDGHEENGRPEIQPPSPLNLSMIVVPSSDEVSDDLKAPDVKFSKITDTNDTTSSDEPHYIDFRCFWKETGLFGTSSHEVIIRYFLQDGSTRVKFEGVTGEWLLTVLEGPYGPVDRYDLFIGAKIKLFGRSLTIAAANASVCHWIDVRGKELKKLVMWFQNKIETVGAIPVIRRIAPTVTRYIVRSNKAEGHQNLRKLKIDIAKLGEQLADLGLGYLIDLESIKL